MIQVLNIYLKKDSIWKKTGLNATYKWKTEKGTKKQAPLYSSMTRM